MESGTVEYNCERGVPKDHQAKLIYICSVVSGKICKSVSLSKLAYLT